MQVLEWFMNSLLDRKRIVLLTILLVLAFGFRLFVALRLANDTPDDGTVYSQIARNVLEQHVYSHEEQPPFSPSLIRLPGYPFFLAAIQRNLPAVCKMNRTFYFRAAVERSAGSRVLSGSTRNLTTPTGTF